MEPARLEESEIGPPQIRRGVETVVDLDADQVAGCRIVPNDPIKLTRTRRAMRAARADLLPSKF